MQARILYLDRPSSAAAELEAQLRAAGWSVSRPDGPEEALELVRGGACDLVLGALSLAGTELLATARALESAPPVVLLEDFASVRDSVEVVERGAFDTIPCPASPEKVVLSIRRALEQRDLEAENVRLRAAVRERFQLGNLVSRNEAMQRIFQTVEAVADSRASLLIQGESGTGKTRLARAVHARSERRDKPFVVVNCGALPASLLESELFGHVRGAFTGAVADRAGKFEAADGGTIFLDEIGTAPHDLQVKLLRVIEEGRFERVGDTRTREVDARVIAATNIDLAEAAERGEFRLDLYYRIHVVGIEMPPLRERSEDVPLLAERFLARFAETHRRAVKDFAPDALVRLCGRRWPGNVRELENTIERAVLLAGGPTLGVRDLWPGEDPGEAPERRDDSPWGELPLGPLKDALAIPERWIILRALRFHGGNRQATAHTLGINRTTLFNKMRKFNLSGFPTKMEEGDAGDDDALREAS